MQYLREETCGNRVPVSREQWAIDQHDPNYHRIIVTSALTIYKLAKPQGVVKGMKPLRFGGRGRGGPTRAWNGA